MCGIGRRSPRSIVATVVFAAFLDVFGDWDASLLFVMAGAVGVYAAGRRVMAGWRRPLFAPEFSSPTPTRIDGRLIAGAILFGVGWGLGGLCPGPALVALGAGTRAAVWFVPAMVAGMLLHDRVGTKLARRRPSTTADLDGGGERAL